MCACLRGRPTLRGHTRWAQALIRRCSSIGLETRQPAARPGVVRGALGVEQLGPLAGDGVHRSCRARGDGDDPPRQLRGGLNVWSLFAAPSARSRARFHAAGACSGDTSCCSPCLLLTLVSPRPACPRRRARSEYGIEFVEVVNGVTHTHRPVGERVDRRQCVGRPGVSRLRWRGCQVILI